MLENGKYIKLLEILNGCIKLVIKQLVQISKIN